MLFQEIVNCFTENLHTKDMNVDPITCTYMTLYPHIILCNHMCIIHNMCTCIIFHMSKEKTLSSSSDHLIECHCISTCTVCIKVDKWKLSYIQLPLQVILRLIVNQPRPYNNIILVT